MKFYYHRHTVYLCVYCMYICAFCINRLRTNFPPFRIYMLDFLRVLPQVTPFPLHPRLCLERCISRDSTNDLP